MLDSASIIGGKCPVSSGSGKSPGLNQFAFCGLRWELPCSSREGENREETSSYFVHTLKVDGFRRFLTET